MKVLGRGLQRKEWYVRIHLVKGFKESGLGLGRNACGELSLIFLPTEETSRLTDARIRNGGNEGIVRKRHMTADEALAAEFQTIGHELFVHLSMRHQSVAERGGQTFMRTRKR